MAFGKFGFITLQLLATYYILWMLVLPLLDETTHLVVKPFFPRPEFGWAIPSLLLTFGFGACCLTYPWRIGRQNAAR